MMCGLCCANGTNQVITVSALASLHDHSSKGADNECIGSAGLRASVAGLEKGDLSQLSPKSQYRILRQFARFFENFVSVHLDWHLAEHTMQGQAACRALFNSPTVALHESQVHLCIHLAWKLLNSRGICQAQRKMAMGKGDKGGGW